MQPVHLTQVHLKQVRKKELLPEQKSWA